MIIYTHASRRSIYSRIVFLFLVIFFCLALMTVSGQQVPVLTVSTEEGDSAEFSDYSLTNYEYTGSAYTGEFCSTLTNTSQRPADEWPVFINGFALNRSAGFVLSGFSDDVGFDDYDPGISGPDPVDLEFYPFLVSGQIGFFPYRSGIPDGGSGTFCLVLENQSPFDLDSLIPNISIFFDDGMPSSIGGHGSAIVTTTVLTPTRYCFSVSNRTGSPKITGIGFDLSDSIFRLQSSPVYSRQHRAPFYLISIEGADAFTFSTASGRLELRESIPRLLRRFDYFDLDFAILAPGPFRSGNPSFGANEFSACIGGDFSGFDQGIELEALIRVEGSWLRPDITTGGGFKGTVSTNPR